jgi:hypothetical protein
MKAAEEMKREQKEVKLRMILQDYHRRNNYELQQAVNDILALDALPPAEGAKKVQWSGYGELGNISQKPLQPTAEGAEEILTNLETYYDFKFHWIERDRMIRAMHEFATLHAQKIADKMVSERLNNAPKNCPKAAQCAHVEGGMKCPPNIICPI